MDDRDKSKQGIFKGRISFVSNPGNSLHIRHVWNEYLPSPVVGKEAYVGTWIDTYLHSTYLHNYIKHNSIDSIIYGNIHTFPGWIYQCIVIETQHTHIAHLQGDSVFKVLMYV